jgi:DNA-binding transcriptional regulator YiaG
MNAKSEQTLTVAQIQALEHLDWLTTDGGLGVTEIARRLELHHPTVSRWKNRVVPPSKMACRLIENLYDEVQRERQAKN